MISAAGFGIRTAWASKSDSSLPQGHPLTFHSAIHLALTNLFFKMLTPDWASVLLASIPVPYLTARTKETKLAFAEVRLYMLDVIASARDAMTNGDANVAEEAAPALLQNLVEANMAQEGPTSNRRLTDDELLSDVFVCRLFLSTLGANPHIRVYIRCSFSLVMVCFLNCPFQNDLTTFDTVPQKRRLTR